MSDPNAEPSSSPRARVSWLHDLLPFLTSLSVHASVVVIGLLTYQAIRVVTSPPPQEHAFTPLSEIVADDSSGGSVKFTGNNSNPFERMTQNQTLDSTAQFAPSRAVGSAAQLSSLIGTDAAGTSGDSFAVGARMGPAGQPAGGIDGGTGPFGAGGGGAIGPQGPVFTNGGSARTIVFVCDCTGSMINKIAQVKIELSRTVQGLKPIQSFNIVFYQDDKVLKLNGALMPATPENKRKAEAWLGDIFTAGKTDPVPALSFALGEKPQLLYFLTDAADFPDVAAVQNVFRKANPDHKTKVNTILFVESQAEQEANKESEPLMRGISGENGGVFKWVRMDQLN